MTNFILRLVKRRGVDKTKRPAYKKDDSSDNEDDKEDGVVESKFDYDEGVMLPTPTTSQTQLDVRRLTLH